MELRLALLVVCAFVGFASAGPKRPIADNRLVTAAPADLVRLLRQVCSDVQDEVKHGVPAQFAELVHSLKSLPRATIASVHKQVREAEFCASSKLADIWNDALIMDASEGSLKLIAEQIIRKEVSASRANYLFTMMAFARNPSAGAVRAVLPILEEREVPRQALLGISALIRNSWTAGRPQQTPEVRDAVKAIVKYMERNIKYQDRVIAALKALQNIGAIDEAIEKVTQLAGDASQKSGVRVAAIEAMRAHAAHPQIRSKCMNIFQNTQESSEIRIAAYKIAVASNDRQTVNKIVQVIRKEENKQVGAFVTTHLKNLRDSSSPRHESVRQFLQNEKIPTERFPQDLRKYSRNFEVSQYVERLGLGGVFDADLIYDKSFAPRSIRMNLTVPVFESEFNMFEFGFRQVGLEDEIRKLVGPHLRGRNAPEILTEIVSEFVEMFDQESNDVQNARSPRNLKKRQNIFQKLNSKDVEAAFYLNFDGKTIAYLDMADLSQPENDMSHAIRSLMQQIKQADKTDRAYSLMFAKNEFEVPSKDGKMPVAVNGTIIFGLKKDRNTFVPSLAIEMSTRMNNKRYEQRVSSSAALGFNVEYKNNRPTKLSLKMPKESQTLFHAHSAVFDIDSQGVESSSSAAYKKISKCSNSLTRPFGIEFCGKMSAPDDMLGNGIPPFNGLWEAELEVRKTDRQMSGWEVELELPQSGEEEQTYRLSFQTPSSRINRRVAFLIRAYDQFRGLQINLESPSNSWDASASYLKSGSEIQAKSELKIGSGDKYSLEAGVKKEQKGKKQDWTPVLRISGPGMRPIALNGLLSVSRGRKSQLSFELKSENDSRFVRGSFVKDGAFSMVKEFRVSSDVHADLGPISFRVFSSAEQQANSVSADLKVDYQTPNSRKHSVKLTGKLHNLSTASYSKVNSFVEAQTSQYPWMNFHVSWNVLFKPNEHVENELTVMWDRQMRDQSKKIHILQVSKATGLLDGQTVTADNILSVEIAPVSFKYEVKASGSMERSQTPNCKVQLEVNNKNRKDDDMQATFEVHQFSSKPFKMSMDASFITSARELRYSDKVEEVSPRVYKGRTQFQWQQDKKTTIGYTLKVKSDSLKTDLEMDAEIKTPSMRHGLRHQGLLRATFDAVDLHSKVFYEKSNIWDIESSLRREGKSEMRVTLKGFEGKAEAHLSSSPQSVIIDLKGNDFSHYSSLLIAQEAITLTSKSMSDQRPVLVINFRKNAKDATRVNVECGMFDARIEMSGMSESPATALFDFRGKTGNKVALKTKAKFSLDEGLELSGETKSDAFAPHSANLKVKKSGAGVSVAVHSERSAKEWIAGKALLEHVSIGVRATAQVSVSGSQVGRFQTQLHRQLLAGPHDLEINFRPTPSSPQQTLKIHHEIGNGEAKCVCTYLVDGQQKAQLENFGRFRASHTGLAVAAGVELKSEVSYHGFDRLHLSFEHEHKDERRNFQSESRVKYQMSEVEKYELAVTSARSGDRKAGKASAKVTLETPKYDFKSQSSQLAAQWTQEKITLQHKTTSKNVNIGFEVNISQSDLISGPHDLTAEYAVPRYAPWSLQARHEIKNGNLMCKAELRVNGQMHSSAQAIGQLKHRNGRIQFAGPHDLEINFQTPSSEPQSLKLHHEAKDGKIKCRLTHSIRGQEKQRLENEAEARCPAARDCQLSATLSLKSQLYPQLDGLQASIEHKHKIDRKNLQSETKVRGSNKDDKYQVSVALFGNGDGRQGKASLKASAETPIANFEKQSCELNALWTAEKLTLQHKTVATGVNIDVKTNISRRQAVNGPHDVKIEFAAPGVQSYAAAASHEITAGDLKTSVEVIVNGEQKLKMNANGKLRQTNTQMEATLNAELNNQRFTHATELQKAADGLALDSKTYWQDQAIVILKSQVYQRKASFVDIDCPIFKLRADAADLTSPATGSLTFANKIGRKETISCRFTIQSGRKIEVHAEGKSASIPECSVDLKGEMSGRFCSIKYQIKKERKEYNRGEGEINWETGVRAQGSVTSKGSNEIARCEINLAEDLISGPHDAKIEFVTPRSNPYSLQMKHQLVDGALRSSSDVRVDGKERLAIIVTGLAKRTNDRIELNLETTAKTPSNTHQIKYESFARQSSGETEAKNTLTVQNKKYMEVHGLYSANKKIASFECEHVNAKFEMSSGREDRLTAKVVGKRFTHFTEVVSKARVVTLDSKSHWENRPIAVLAARLHQTDACFFDIQSRLFDGRIETDSASSPTTASANYASKFGDRKAIKCRIALNGRSKLEATAEWKSDRTPAQAAKFEATMGDKSADCRFNLKRDGEEVAAGQSEVSFDSKTIKVTARLAEKKKDSILTRFEVSKNWINGPHEMKFECKAPRCTPCSLEAKHTTENGNLKTKFEVLVNGEQRLAVDAAGQLKQARDRFELNLEGSIKTASLNHHVKYETFARQSQNAIEAKSKMSLQKQPFFDVQSIYSPERNMIKFENDQIKGKIEAVFGRESRYTADVSGSHFTHFTQAVGKSDEWTMDSKTHWDRRPIVVVKSRVHNSEKSFFEIESLMMDGRVEVDNIRYPSIFVLNVANKVGDQKMIKCRVAVDGIKSLEISAEAKSASLPKCSILLNARNTESAYVIQYQVKKNGQEYCAGDATIAPRGHGLNAKAKMTQEGKEICRLDAQVNGEWVNGPHDIEVLLPQTRRSQAAWYKIHHEIVNGKVNSSVVRIVNGKERPIGDLSGRGVLDAVAGLYMKA